VQGGDRDFRRRSPRGFQPAVPRPRRDGIPLRARGRSSGIGGTEGAAPRGLRRRGHRLRRARAARSWQGRAYCRDRRAAPALGARVRRWGHPRARRIIEVRAPLPTSAVATGGRRAAARPSQGDVALRATVAAWLAAVLSRLRWDGAAGARGSGGPSGRRQPRAWEEAVVVFCMSRPARATPSGAARRLRMRTCRHRS